MKYPRACQIVSMNAACLAANSYTMHVPGAGRAHDGISGSLEPIIYSITLATVNPAATSGYGVQVYGWGSDQNAIFAAYDTMEANTCSTMHVTFPNGLPCRQATDVGTLLVGNTAGCQVLGRQKNNLSPGLPSDVDYCPSVYVNWFDIEPADYTLTVTYGYAHQSELQP